MRVLLFDRSGVYPAAVVYSLSMVPGIRIGLLTGEAVRAIKSSRFVHFYQTFSLDASAPDGLAGIEKAIRRFRPDVLMPVDEDAVFMVSSNREALKRLTRVCPVPSLEAFQTAVDKYRLNRFLRDNHFPNPRSWLVTGGNITFKDRRLPFPVIAKPLRGSGGKGIQRISDKRELDSFLSALSPSDEYIIQELIAGNDVDCSILYHQNRVVAYTIQKPLRPKNDFGYAMTIEFTKNQDVLNLVTDFVERLGFNGLAHIDMLQEPGSGRIHILDINVRYWATLLGSTVAGVNFPYLACRLALDQTFPLPEFKNTTFAVGKALIKNWRDVRSGKERERIPFMNSTIPFLLKDPGYLWALLSRRRS